MRKKVDRVFVDERRGTWKLYFLRVRACLCRGPPWNRECHRSRPDRKRYPYPCLVCFDCQLFLCATLAEGTVQAGKHVVTPHPVTFLTELQVEFLGIFISILGAVTVVFSANTSDTRLDRDALIAAITQKPFIIYSITYIIGAFILAGLSASHRGRDWVFVDVGMCALFGTWCVYVRRVPFLTRRRRVHSVIDESAVDASHNGMDKDFHRVDHLSNRCRKLVCRSCPISVPMNIVTSRSSLALGSAK
jgi:hypothetical protein